MEELELYIKQKIDLSYLRDWAIKKQHMMLCDKLIFNIEALKCYPLLSEIIASSETDTFSIQDAQHILKIFKGQQSYIHYTWIKMPSPFMENTLNKIQRVYSRYSENGFISVEDFENMEKILADNQKKTNDIRNHILGNLLELIKGLPMSKLSETSYNCIYTNDKECLEGCKIDDHFMVLRGTKVFHLTLNYTETFSIIIWI